MQLTAVCVWGARHPLCASLRQCRTPRTTTTIINCLSMLFERTDEVVLPAIYKFVAASFNASLTELGYLTLARSLSQALLSPLGGILGGPLSIPRVLSLPAPCPPPPGGLR